MGLCVECLLWSVSETGSVILSSLSGMPSLMLFSFTAPLIKFEESARLEMGGDGSTFSTLGTESAGVSVSCCLSHSQSC